MALLDQIRSIFDGDPGVRKVADDRVLSAELLMLFRMILADGAVSESEMVAFRHICKEAFGIPEASIDASSNISTTTATRPTAHKRSRCSATSMSSGESCLRATWPRSRRRIPSLPRAR